MFYETERSVVYVYQKEKKIPEEKKLTNDSNIKNTTATKKHKHEINMNLDP